MQSTALPPKLVQKLNLPALVVNPAEMAMASAWDVT